MPRAALVLLLAAGCCARAAKTAPTTPRPTEISESVVWDFEKAVLADQDALLQLFDFASIGKLEKLLRRYDVLGRAQLTDAQMKEFSAEDATPFTAERERRMVGYFYPSLGQRTVGRGGCKKVAPQSEYVQWLGEEFEPLEPGLEHYEPLRREVNGWIARGGLVVIKCDGGQGQLGLVWTAEESERGYKLIAIYDDVPPSP